MISIELNNKESFTFKLLQINGKSSYGFDSSELSFVDSYNETISFNDFGCYYFKNKMLQRNVYIEYSDNIFNELNNGNAVIELEVENLYFCHSINNSK